MTNSPVGGAVFKVIRKNIWFTLLLLLSIFGVVFFTLVPPQILRKIIDDCLVPGVPLGLITLAFVYLAASILNSLFEFIKGAVLTVLGQRITMEIQSSMMEKLSRLSAAYFSDHDPGTVVSRFTNDVDTINSLFSNGIIGIAVDCFKIIGILISVWMFSGTLGVVILASIPIIFFITRAFQKRMLSAELENRRLVAKVNNLIAESLANVRMIKAFSKEKYMEEKYSHSLLENYRTVEKVNQYDSVFAPIIVLLKGILIVFVVMASSKQLNFLGISLGMVAASIDLIGNIFLPIEHLGMELQSIQSAISGIQKVNEFFHSPDQSEQDEDLPLPLAQNKPVKGEGESLAQINAGKPDETLSQSLRQSKCGKQGEVLPQPFKQGGLDLEFRQLTFAYGRGPKVLDGISLTIPFGQKITFVGRTGVGKSTLFRLILGLLEPQSGQVTLSGVSLHRIPNREKRNLFGYVDQTFHLIPGTAADQISLKDPAITRKQVEGALEFVGLLEEVRELPQGLDTVLYSESVFSQGQKQLLAIARAIVTDPPILLLDEITANMDSITEEQVVSVLGKAGACRTILSISHRLSSMLSCDQVVILEKGKIRNSGIPEELIQKDPWYRSRLELERLTWD